MINKKHLLDSIKEEYPFISEDFYEMVKGFPEEPEIDFDVLFVEWINSHCDNILNGCGINPVETASCFKDFLKSKHLTAPKQSEIPVKKYWTLKKEFLDFVETVVPTLTIVTKCETKPVYTKYYDYHEEPDYSQIPVGSVVCINGIYAGVVSKILEELKVLHLRFSVNDNANMSIYFCDIKSLEILKWPENVK